MMGLDPDCLKTRHVEALEAIIALLTSEEPVDRKTDWFTLNQGRLQLRPYRDRPVEVVVSALSSLAGPKLAGRFGTGLLSLGLLAHGGAKRLQDVWQTAEQSAAEHGKTMDRQGLRLAGAAHASGPLGCRGATGRGFRLTTRRQTYVCHRRAARLARR